MGGCASKESSAKEPKKDDDTGFVIFLLMSHAWVNSTMSMGCAWISVELLYMLCYLSLGYHTLSTQCYTLVFCLCFISPRPIGALLHFFYIHRIAGEIYTIFSP